uniref:Uncharacterized protein n=1 Tax=Oryza punctata TaxID=4537 RepID=A0A0E0LH87_ORYPU
MLIKRYLTRKSKGEEKVSTRAELIDHLKRLEGVLGDNIMFRGYEQHGGFEFEIECPELMRLVERCKERQSVKSILLEEEMYDLHKKWYDIE